VVIFFFSPKRIIEVQCNEFRPSRCRRKYVSPANRVLPARFSPPSPPDHAHAHLTPQTTTTAITSLPWCRKTRAVSVCARDTHTGSAFVFEWTRRAVRTRNHISRSRTAQTPRGKYVHVFNYIIIIIITTTLSWETAYL